MLSIGTQGNYNMCSCHAGQRTGSERPLTKAVRHIVYYTMLQGRRMHPGWCFSLD